MMGAVGAALVIIAAALVAAVGGLADVVVPIIAGTLGVVAIALVALGRRIQPSRRAVQDREPLGHLGYPCACTDRDRRRLLGGAAVAVVIVGGLGASIPFRSVIRRAERRLRRTSWGPGTRLVDDRQQPILAEDLELGTFITVWPEGHRDEGDSQAVLIRLRDDRSVTAPGRDDWVVEGCVAYSKLCTHMGCPVGLYQTRSDLLVCPCHQATFDVLAGAKPVRGPASRPLPQLPLAIDDEGHLVAFDDFPEPVGPGFWSRPS